MMIPDICPLLFQSRVSSEVAAGRRELNGVFMQQCDVTTLCAADLNPCGWDSSGKCPCTTPNIAKPLCGWWEKGWLGGSMFALCNSVLCNSIVLQLCSTTQPWTRLDSIRSTCLAQQCKNVQLCFYYKLLSLTGLLQPSQVCISNTSTARRQFSVHLIKAAGSLEADVWKMGRLVPESLFVEILHHSNDNRFIYIIGSWRQRNTAWQPGFFSEMYCLAYSTNRSQPGCRGIATLQVPSRWIPAWQPQFSLSILSEEDPWDEDGIVPG